VGTGFLEFASGFCTLFGGQRRLGILRSHRNKIKISEHSPVFEGELENVTKRRKYIKNTWKASNKRSLPPQRLQGNGNDIRQAYASEREERDFPASKTSSFGGGVRAQI